jgi:chorismate synthase
MKPIATTLTPQETVNLETGEQVPTQYERSDFCPVPRAVPILEGMIAYVLADALMEKIGGDTLSEMVARYEALPRPQLSDLQMDGNGQVWWPQ